MLFFLMLLDINWTFRSVWMLKGMWAGVCFLLQWSWMLMLRMKWWSFPPLAALVQENAVVFIHFLWQCRCYGGRNAWNQVRAESLCRGSGGTVAPLTNSLRLCWKSDDHLPHQYLGPALLVCCQFPAPNFVWWNQPVSGLCQGADCK